MRNISRSAIAGGLLLALASGCSTSTPLRVKNTQRVTTNPTKTAATQALKYDALNLGTKYISSPIPSGYTAEVDGQILPRGNVLLYLNPAQAPTIDNRTYSAGTNSSFAVNVVYTNGMLMPNTANTLANTKIKVHSQPLEGVATSTGILSETITMPSVHFPQKTVSIDGNKLRVVEDPSTENQSAKYLLFVSEGNMQQRIRGGNLEVIENVPTYCIFPGQLKQIPAPVIPVETNQTQSAIDSIPLATVESN